MFALGWQDALQDHKIRVEVDHGCVTLDGEVDHAFQSRAAEAMVSRECSGASGRRSIVRTMRSATRALMYLCPSSVERMA